MDVVYSHESGTKSEPGIQVRTGGTNLSTSKHAQLHKNNLLMSCMEQEQPKKQQIAMGLKHFLHIP
jgi:hypothetical protein